MRVFQRAWLEIRRGFSCSASGIVAYHYFHMGNSEAGRIKGKGRCIGGLILVMIQGDDRSGSFADGERGRSPDNREGG